MIATRRPSDSSSACSSVSDSARPPISTQAPTTSNTAVPIPSALPQSNWRLLTPMLSTWRRVPLSRSPENAVNPRKMIKSGISSCRIMAPLRSPKRPMELWSVAGRPMAKFCLCASMNSAVPA